MEIALPIIVLGLIALIFAVILAVLNIKLAVKTDPKEEETVSLLCGANCGACGFAGCSQFATALIRGEASINDCNATSQENKKKIAQILGESAELKPTKVIVACNGGNKCSNKYEYSGYAACREANALLGGVKECNSACLGYGTCAEICPHGAIAVTDGKAVVNRALCVNCGLCLKSCPKSVIVRIDENAKIFVACSNREKGKTVMQKCSVGCIACGLCAKVCPSNAIKMTDNLPVIDYDLCTACGKCVTKCPRNTIIKL